MAWFNRTNGLICGGIAATFCIAVFIARCFETGSWLWVPIGALVFWGGISLHELVDENNRREKILRKMGVSRIDELTG